MFQISVHSGVAMLCPPAAAGAVVGAEVVWGWAASRRGPARCHRSPSSRGRTGPRSAAWKMVEYMLSILNLLHQFWILDLFDKNDHIQSDFFPRWQRRTRTCPSRTSVGCWARCGTTWLTRRRKSTGTEPWPHWQPFALNTFEESQS